MYFNARTLLIASVGALLLGAVAFAPARGEAADPSAAAVTSNAQQPGSDMPGCPGKANGAACCASCQAQRAAEAAAAPAEKPAGCPCQRARAAAKAAAAAGAAQ